LETGAMMPISHTSPSGAPGDGSAVVLERSRRPLGPTTARCLPVPQVDWVDGASGSKSCTNRGVVCGSLT
jgi:hypothetical protein